MLDTGPEDGSKYAEDMVSTPVSPLLTPVSGVHVTLTLFHDSDSRLCSPQANGFEVPHRRSLSQPSAPVSPTGHTRL